MHFERLPIELERVLYILKENKDIPYEEAKKIYNKKYKEALSDKDFETTVRRLALRRDILFFGATPNILSITLKGEMYLTNLDFMLGELYQSEMLAKKATRQSMIANAIAIISVIVSVISLFYSKKI